MTPRSRADRKNRNRRRKSGGGSEGNTALRNALHEKQSAAKNTYFGTTVCAIGPRNQKNLPDYLRETIPRGTRVTVLSEHDGWYQIVHKDQTLSVRRAAIKLEGRTKKY